MATLRSGVNYDSDVVSHKTGLACTDLSRAKQSEKDICDINRIVKNFGVTGHIPQSTLPPQYGDFTGVTDYQSALNALMEAQDSFYDLDAALRKRFGNDPREFVDFVTNPDNLDEARKLGLAPSLPVDAAPAANGLPASADGETSPAV